MTRSGRLSTLQAAFVIARRDFGAILLSRTFIFFLLGPLFPLLVGGLAGGIGRQVQDTANRPVLGVAMSAADTAALLAAHKQLEPQLGESLPELVVVERLASGTAFDPKSAMLSQRANLAAIVSGPLAAPVLTGPVGRIEGWSGTVGLLSAQAQGLAPRTYPPVALTPVETSRADQTKDRLKTAQAAQVMLFLLTTMLAGMVLSTLVEEKGNKIIEVLAAAIPMDAVFFGKLFAMLGVSLIGIATWGLFGGTVRLLSGQALVDVAAPAVGWPVFFGLFVAYFALAYLLLGALFLTIGSMAQTVREVQTMSMPATMLQVLLFFFAFYAMARPGTWIELAAQVIPLSSPFAMLAKAAKDPALWPHILALCWQALCVALMVRGGAIWFRKRVMQSGNAGAAKRGLFTRRGPSAS